MPAIKCDNDKWKWGENGSCIYDSKAEAEKDNEDYYRDVSDIDLSVTKGMIEEARKGLDWRKEFDRGGTEVGVKTANMIIDDAMTVERVKKMYSYLKRHEVDKQAEGFEVGEDGYPSAGRIAWALWGGDAAVSWSEKKRNQIQEEEEKRKAKVWDKIYNEIDMEKRIFNIETNIERRDVDGVTKDVVVGYGSVYNSRSNNLGGFYEYIEEGAFTDELIERSDVRALINHDASLILARSKNGVGTLKLNADKNGLRYEFDLPDLSYAKDLAVNMANGNLSQSSFAFTVAEDEWSTNDAGENIRTVKKIDNLYDISIVTYPAFNQAEADLVVAKRGLSVYKEKIEREKEEKDLVKRSLVSLKIELIKRNNKNNKNEK
tara:strand:+ start:651 stop:1775 length:1125 start_codon:yes stop_codon:yes gene_type:complete